MNKEQAQEQIKKLIDFTKTAREKIGTPQKDIEIVIGDNQFYLSDEIIQALELVLFLLDDYQEHINKLEEHEEELLDELEKYKRKE